MGSKQRTGSRAGVQTKTAHTRIEDIGDAVAIAIDRGFLVGREVLIGNVPGIVVGYNIASFGRFVGNAYPLVIRTELGVTKCSLDELSLA